MITNLKFDSKTYTMYTKNYGESVLAHAKFNPSFYAKANLLDTGAGFQVEDTDKTYFFTGEKVDRIVALNNLCFSKFNLQPRKYLYMYDLSPVYQFLIYNNIKLSSDYVVSYLDIETDDDLNASEAMSPILLISLLLSDGNVQVFDKSNYACESDMLESFFEWILNYFPDAVMGWNIVEFDKKYILSRAKRLNVNFDLQKFLMIEFINMTDIVLKKFGYQVLKDTGGWSLDKVSTFFLGAGKKKISATFGKLYAADRDLALEYNLTDLLLLEQLDNKLQLFNFLLKIQTISNVLLRDTLFNSVVIDSMILRKYEKHVFPSGVRDDNEVKYEGGYVFSPPKGLFNKVAIIDFTAMYPSIILTFNISPDSKTKSNYDYLIDGVGFNAKPFGIFKETIKSLFYERLRLKNELSLLNKDDMEYNNLDTVQSAFKTVLNSFYGVCAFKRFRFFDVDLAKSITFIGRDILIYIKNKIEESGLGMVIYGDTDSLFMQTNYDISLVIRTINEKFIPDYVSGFGIKDNYLSVELKKVYDQMVLFGKKKKYIAQSDETFYIKGFDTEKYDVPKKFRTMMKEIISILFAGNKIEVESYRSKIKDFDLIDYAMLKRFNKHPDEYKVLPQHLKAKRWSEKYGLLTEETKSEKMTRILFVNIDPKYGYDEIDAIAIDDETKQLPVGVSIDLDKYFNFFIVNKMEDLYDIFGVQYEK